MANAEIRPYRRDDETRVREILEVSWRGQGAAWFFEQTFGMLAGRPWFEWFWPNIEGKLKSHPEWVFVTDIDGHVAGVASLSLDHAHGLGSIGYNAVDPACRGRGLGRRQIEFLMQRFQSEEMRCVGVYVALNDGHRAARAIYEKVGCRTVATIETRYARMPEHPAGRPHCEPGTIRPATAADREAVRGLVARTLSGRHPYAVVERRHGDIWGKPWLVRVMDGLGPAIEGGSGDVLLCERDGTCTGVVVSAASPERQTGVISLLLVDPDARGTATDIALMTTAAERLSAQGLRYLQLSTYLGEDGAGLSSALIDAFGLAELVIRSEYKFQMLGSTGDRQDT